MQRAVIAGVRPTRLELIRLSRREQIARKGRDILQEKLDALVIEHARLTKELETMAVLIQDQLQGAYDALTLAGFITGWVRLEELAAACKKIPEPLPNWPRKNRKIPPPRQKAATWDGSIRAG